MISSMSRMICIYIALSQLGAWVGLGLQVRQRMPAGWGVYSFFRDRSNGRMVEQEFFQNGGSM